MQLDDILLVAVTSANRPQNVASIEAALAPIRPLWFVPYSQAEDYVAAGADVVSVEGELPMKPKQLNAALAYGWGQGKIVATMDDDYVSTKRVYLDSGKTRTRDVTLPDFIVQVFAEFMEHPAKVAGVTTNLNPLWASESSTDYGMITGQILFHKPNDVRFDESLPMMEDLDYVINHHVTHGRVMKVRRYVQEFHMMGRNEKSDATHTGGYAQLRNAERLALAVEIMNHKYRDEEGVLIQNKGLGNPSHERVNFKQIAERVRTNAH